MSCSLYVTRAATLIGSIDSPITIEDWHNLVHYDAALAIEEGSNGECAVWSNPEDSDGYYRFNWFEGAIWADVTSSAVIRKLLEIAGSLNAVVMDDGDHQYVDDSGFPIDWKPPAPQSYRKPFWKFW